MVLLYSPLPIWRRQATEPEKTAPETTAKPSIPLDDTVPEQPASREPFASIRQVQQTYQLERRTFL